MFMKRFPANGGLTFAFIFVIWINNLLVIGFLIGLSFYKMKLLMRRDIERALSQKDKRAVYEKFQDHPDVEKTFLKKFMKLQMKGDPSSFVSAEQLLKNQIKENKIKNASEFIYMILRDMKLYEFFYSLIGLFIAIFALICVQEKQFDKYHKFLYQILLCCISLLDLLHLLLFRHDFSLDLNWKTYLDAGLSLIIIIFSAILFSDAKNYTLIKLWALASLAKMFRFLVFYFRFDRKQLKSNILYPCYRFVWEITIQLIAIFLIFASLGLIFFGGNINSFSLDLYNEDMLTDLNYEYLNFNTFANSLIFLFVIALNNEWPVLANICIINHGNGNAPRRLMKFLFIFFKFFVNYILLNSLIAFIIEIFHQYEKKK